MQTTGVELLLDLYDCKSPALHDVSALEQILRDAIRLAGFDVVERAAHHSPRQGITLVFILRQSHAALHTWRETGFVTADVYACGKYEAVCSVLEIIRGYLVQRLMARSFNAQLVERGLDTSVPKVAG